MTRKRKEKAKTVTTPDLAVRLHAKLARTAVLLALLLLPSLSSRNTAFAAQTNPKEKPYALIAGTVWGPDDHPVYGVAVKIRRAKDKKAEVAGLLRPSWASSPSGFLPASRTTSSPQI